MIKYFDFETEVEKIDTLIKDLDNDNHGSSKIEKLKLEKNKILEKIYSNLTPWQKVQVSRHIDRPHTLDYLKIIFEDLIFLHGDKKYADDSAIIGGFAKINNQSVIVLGTEKGSDMESRIRHNFGMAKPEGYRKAQRLVSLAEKFNLPIITFVDTAGAFPGKDAEERGQSESIASSILFFLKAKTQIVSIIIGEGGSGGAIGIATSDRVLMLEHSIYSVISPEGCSSILWKSTNYNYKIIDDIISEIPGGAHRHPQKQALLLKKAIEKNISELKNIEINELVSSRKKKYLNITSEI